MTTILFTDIESSTRLWEEHPEEMPAALARHDAILAEAVTSAGGTVVKTTGDGLLAVFDTASAGVIAAIAAQKGIGADHWETTGPIRVRMGIHAGEVESREGDYFGVAMNRAARIMSAAHGGQILVSEAAVNMFLGTMPSDIGFRDLGIHRLKDLTHPEHLYQLIHDGIGTEFPAPMTLDSRPHNLPRQASEFLGRSQELEAIELMLNAASTRLLTITGPGGAGKTRLALQLAAEEINRFRDGAFFVDLSAERDPAAVFEAIVRTLELPVSGGDALQTLKTRLRDRQMLLVLDNFEQVTAAAVGVSELLQAAPEAKVVVTSRETLRVRAERVYPVPPLSLPDPRSTAAEIAATESVQLFTDRAQAVRPGFSINGENAVVVAEICLRLDGLPLAIELAAARLNVFSPSDLLDRLRQRLDILGAGGRDLPDRQRTLWGAIGWSYELLDEEERDVLQVMSVFASADLPTVEAVAASVLGPLPIVDALGSLVDKSLIRTSAGEGSQRFSMLLMVKEFTEARLAESPERLQAVQLAHAAHFTGFSADRRDHLGGSQRQDALEALSAEIDNLNIAWRYWVEKSDIEQLFALVDTLWALHEAKGWYHGAIGLASDILAALKEAGFPQEHAADELTLRTLLARAMMAVHGYGPEVEEAFRRASEMARTAGKAADQIPVLRGMATYYTAISDFARSVEIGRELLDLAEREDDEVMRLEGDYVFGMAKASIGDMATGFAHLDRVIERYDPRIHGISRFRLGPNTAVLARTGSGMMRWQLGELERGVGDVAAALRLAEEIDHPYSIAYALYHNGYLALDRGRYEDALKTAGRLSEVAGENDYLIWSTLATVLEGVARTALGEREKGLAMAETGVALYRGLTTPPVFWPLLLALRSVVHALAGRPDQALGLIREAIELGPSTAAPTPFFHVLEAGFLTMLPEPDFDRAETILVVASEQAREVGLKLAALRAQIGLVELRRQLGRSPDGSEELAAIYGSFTEGFDEADLVTARSLLG